MIKLNMPNNLGNTKTSPILNFQHIQDVGSAVFEEKACQRLPFGRETHFLISEYAKQFGNYQKVSNSQFQANFGSWDCNICRKRYKKAAF